MKKVFVFSIMILLLLAIRGIILSIHNLITNTTTSTTLSQSLQAKMRENQLLTQQLWYVQTNSYIENQAREKLGLVKDGEQFVIAPTPQPTPLPSSLIQEQENWQKWLETIMKN